MQPGLSNRGTEADAHGQRHHQRQIPPWDHEPSGGTKQRGLGRRNGAAGFNEYLESEIIGMVD
jgi:acyl-CoA reductase-like NAD-dependent aldehyde dehydrogenase